MKNILTATSLREAATALLDLAIPRRCIVCGRSLTLSERFICLDCLADFPYTHYWLLSHNPMADRFNARLQEDLDAGLRAAFANAPSCHSEPLSCHSESLSCHPERSERIPPPVEPYAFAAALFFYSADSDYRRIPWHLKYGGGVAAGRCFARMLGERLAASPQFADVDVVVPVPLHWTRQWRRGYNQAEVIAREVADVLGAEFRTDILRRARRTRSQVRLSLPGKAANVRGAFALRPARYARNRHNVREIPEGCAQKHNNVRVRHVLLVDDTFTTGSTLNACRAVLRQAFPLPTRISVATLACVGSE